MKLLISAILTTCFVLSVSTSVIAQEFSLSYDRFSHRDGLSQNTVFAIEQDQSGFVWLGTRSGGLNRYDGYEFKQYLYDSSDSLSISGNEITCIMEDSQGRLWVGTRGTGLNLFDHDSETFTRFKHNDNENSLPQNTILAVHEDQLGSIWVGSGRYTTILDVDQKTFDVLGKDIKKKGAVGKSNCFLNSKDKNTIWVGTTDGLVLVDINTKDIIKRFRHDPNDMSSISGSNIKSLTLDNDKNLWIGTRSNGLNRLDDFEEGKFTRFQHDSEQGGSLVSDIVRTVSHDQLGNLWVGTKEGLDLLTPDNLSLGNFIHIRAEEGNINTLSQSSIYSFLEDDKGDYWVGTWSGGLNYLYTGAKKMDHIQYIPNKPSSLSSNFVSAFESSEDGLWIGTEGGGLNLYQKESGLYEIFREGDITEGKLKSNHIKALHIDQSGDLWVGTFYGLSMYDRKRKVFTTYFNEENVTNVIEGAKDEIWVGTSRGLHKMNKKDGSFETFMPLLDDPNSLSYYHVNGLYKDKNEDIWVGTREGLNRYRSQTNDFKTYNYNDGNPNTLSHPNVLSITQDKQGYLWIGSINALNRLDPESNTISVFGVKSGLPANAVNNTIVDDQGYLWITTNRGVSKITLPVSGGASKLDIRNFDLIDGVQGYEFTQAASYKNAQGQLFFGGTNGFNVIDPVLVSKNFEEPRVVLTSFKLFNEEVKVSEKNSPLTERITRTKNIVLNHKQSVITIGYTALNFKQSHNNRYAYKLEGFDKEWVYVDTRRQAYYSNLPAGNYTFHVRISTTIDSWEETDVALSITVLPAWWATWWFRAVMALALIGLIVLFFMNRINRTKIKTMEAFAEKSNFLSIMSHEIRTPLNAIVNIGTILSEEKRLPAQEPYLQMLKFAGDNLMNLVNNILDFSKIEESKIRILQEPFNLRLTVDSLYSSLALEAMEKKVPMKLNMDESLPEEVIGDSTRLIQVLNNLISNAIKFANEQLIEVSIKCHDLDAETVTIYFEVKDHGIGIPADMVDKIFDRFVQVHDTTTRKYGGSGLGLTISSRLIRMMKSEINIESEEGVGTNFNFILTLPLAKTSSTTISKSVNSDLTNQEIRLLLVEDNAMNRMIAERFLRKWGILVETAEDGKQAVAAAHAAAYDIILMDLQMPIMGGLEASRLIKQIDTYRNVPIIALTASTEAQIKRDYMEDAIIQDWISKPFDPDRLYKKITQALAKDQETTGLFY